MVALSEIATARAQGRQVVATLDTEMSALREKGMVDMKGTVYPSRHTTTANIAIVAANALRQYRLGLGQPVI